ncbi:hypothetical protein [uncultured Parolsenella sp.]|uniref:hypothetical protein n=1 Tax=uncultured Parolsenella sp. TaxID=2083008 RepID=UPI00265B1BDE|nr:hypothetical protein [uncultured Parolsenella sp.]
MDYGELNPLVMQEASILNDVQIMKKRSKRGGWAWACEAAAMLELYGTSFDNLPPYLRAVIDEIDLAD